MDTRMATTTSLRFGRCSARLLVSAALCAALVAATPATARAETVDDADATGDMATQSLVDDEEEDTLVPAPERTLNDVSSTMLAHRTRRVAIRVDYVDLKKKAGGEPQVLDIAMVTDEGVRRHLQLAAWSGHWSGETNMYDGNWRGVKCSVRHSIDYKANVTKVSFPRRCASNPSWVRFRVGSYIEDAEVYFVDDALRDRPMTDEDKGRFKRSEPVHREPTQ